MKEIDSEILKIMREDGRISWRDLGAAVGLTANAAADRVRRLRQAGVITGFAALVDPAAGGRGPEAPVRAPAAHAPAERGPRLRQAGVITGFAALVDPAAGGRVLEALVGVTLSR